MVSTLLLAGCTSKEVTVYTSAQQEYSEQQAQKIVERSFYEDIAKERVQAVLFFDEGIILSHGTMTNTSGTAVAAPIGADAIASGKSPLITTELGRRIYYTSIGNITIYGSVKNNNRYLAYIYHKDGRDLKNLFHWQKTCSTLCECYVQFSQTL